MVDILNHIFALCYSDRVRTAWIWLREKVIKMMSDQGPAPDLSNTELLLFIYPRCRREAEVIFLLTIYKEPVAAYSRPESDVLSLSPAELVSYNIRYSSSLRHQKQ